MVTGVSQKEWSGMFTPPQGYNTWPVYRLKALLGQTARCPSSNPAPGHPDNDFRERLERPRGLRDT